MPRTLHGVLPIVHMPFTPDDEIDLLALDREIEWIYKAGADGLGTGMVSEVLKLTFAERIDLAIHLVKRTAGRGSVFVSVGAESTRQALLYARAAEKAGCDAVMAVPPVTSALPEAALLEYYRAIADAITIPVIVQDASGYVGKSIPMGVHVALLDQYGPEKIVFKPEASPIGPNLTALRLATGGRARIFEGSGGIFLPESFRRGIVGTMPGVEILDGIVALWRALQRGDEAAVERISAPIGALVAIQMQSGLDGFLAVEKYLLVKRGLFTSAARRKPYSLELDAETIAEVDRLFARLLQAIA